MPGIFSALFSSNPIYDERYWTTGGTTISNTTAGELVTDDTVLTSSAWYAALRNISEDIAKLPAYAVQYQDDINKVRNDEHIVTYLFYYAPNSYQNPMTFRAQMQHWKHGWGNAYAEIERDANMNPIALHPRHPGTIQPEWDNATGRLKYKWLKSYRFQGGKMVDKHEDYIDADNMFHLRGLGSDPLQGYSVIRYAANSLSLTLAAEAFGASSFKNRGAVTSILRHPAKLNDVARSKFKESFDAAYRGARKSGGWLLLEDGMEYQQLSISPDDMQFLQTRQLQIEEVCRWIRIPPSKIQHLMRANYNTLENENRNYVTDCLQGEIKGWEEEAQRKLFRRDERNMRLYHNMNALLRGDIAAQTDHVAKMIDKGVYSINEALQYIGGNTIGPIGDQRFVNANLMRLKENMLFPAEIKAATPSQSAPMTTPEPPDVEDDDMEETTTQLATPHTNDTPTTPRITREQAWSIVWPVVERAERKAEKAVPRIEKKHGEDVEAASAAIAEFHTELRAEIIVNLCDTFTAFGGDEETLKQTIALDALDNPNAIDYQGITTALVSHLVGD